MKRGIDGNYDIKVGVDPGPAYGVLNQLLRDIGLINANISVGVLKTGADGYVTMADGAVVQAFAGGTENHIAQIAPAGAWRVWAEDETGGEAYIPLAMSKRPRSEAILADVAERFGGAFVKYATAGMPVAGGDGASMGGMVYVGVDQPQRLLRRRPRHVPEGPGRRRWAQGIHPAGRGAADRDAADPHR